MQRIKNLFNFLKMESMGGFLLIFASCLAMIASNFLGPEIYFPFKNFGIKIFYLDKPLYLWVNDGLMAIFFFLIGLELKREFTTGHLSLKNSFKIPLIGAIGGFLLPILIFIAFTYKTPFIRGWAIPAATDIAFTLAIISILSNIPKPIKALIIAITIFDDIAAILTISIFFTKSINYTYIILSLSVFLASFLILKKKNNYFLLSLLGFLLWLFVFKSGIHATIAGILLSMTIPEKNLINIENKIHPFVAYFILPLFAFVNAGVVIETNSIFQTLLSPLVLGISFGLFIGKPLGVTLFVYIGSKLKFCKLKSIKIEDIAYISILTGIGFTMSFFIGNLAFNDYTALNGVKIGVLLGSLLSALVGYIFCKRHFKN